MSSYYEAGRGYRYDFRLYGHRYRAPRGFRTKALCDKAERALRDRIMAAKAGIPPDPTAAPSFTTWAGVTYEYAVTRKGLRDPATFERTLRRVLAFWGAKPADPKKVLAGAPYHDLTLDAPLRDGSWLLRFEEWMQARQLAGATKNHYRSACSRLYAVAMAPAYRQQTGIVLNPFRGIPRDRTRRRTETFTRAQLAQLLTHGPLWLETAIRLALYAPALRLGNIVALEWRHIQDGWIRIEEHKTAGHGRPLVSPIVSSLAAHLATVPRPTRCRWVVQEHGAYLSVRQVQDAFRAAVEAVGLPYGTGVGEYSFHSLRHTAATLMAEIGIPDGQRQEAIGHLALATTQGYTHMTPVHRIAPLETLGAELDRVAGLPRKDPRSAIVRSSV